MPFNALVFTLRSKVELNWTRAIRPVIAQTVQFGNIDLCQFFFSSKGSTVLIKIMNLKKGVTVLVFAVQLRKVRTKCIFSDFRERTGASFKIECVRKGEESIKKSVFTEFTWRYHI